MITTSEVPLITSRKKLDELWLHVTSRCNLQCSHCLFSCSPEQNQPGTLSLEEAKDYALKALSNQIKTIYITGGEPLLWPYLKEFLQWYYTLKNPLPLTILSNGILITKEYAKFINNFVPKGLSLRISLECYTKENHDQFRGDGNFEKTLKGIKELNSEKIAPWIAYVNKSGGSLPVQQAKSLEKDFLQRLKEDFGIDIAGLKIIGAYKKGRFSGLNMNSAKPAEITNLLDKVQCTYGIAVSNLGVVPCPILTDLPEAVINRPFDELIGQTFQVNYDFCASCFATGSSCGQ